MDIQSQIQDSLELSQNVSLLLQKQADRLLHQRDQVVNTATTADDLDLSKLGRDVELASRCLAVLECRRELRAAIKDLVEIRGKMDDESYDQEPEAWADYAQDAIDRLQSALREALQVANDEESGKHPPHSPTHTHRPPPAERRKSNTASRRRNTISNTDPYHSSDVSPRRSAFAQQQQPLSSPLSITSGDLPPESEPFMPGSWNEPSPLSSSLPNESFLSGYHSSPFSFSSPSVNTNTWVSNNNPPLYPSHDSDSDDEHDHPELFVDAEEEVDFPPAGTAAGFYHVQDGNSSTETITEKTLTPTRPGTPASSGGARTRKHPTAPFAYDYTPAFDSRSVSLEAPYPRASSSTFASLSSSISSRSSTSSQESESIGTEYSSSGAPFAEEVSISNPLRVGVGYGSYIVYTCTVRGGSVSLRDRGKIFFGASVSVRKRYSDFVALRALLVKHHPHFKTGLPKLPPKKVVGTVGGGTSGIEAVAGSVLCFISPPKFYALTNPMLAATPQASSPPPSSRSAVASSSTSSRTCRSTRRSATAPWSSAGSRREWAQ
ncbi:hypothetical protein BC938DRAFT_473722 [Jimgerdemannia flammicorona]|uniref:PX domain-containing protein n=1 Tax=Jimgerdemannia flammicorona TaxID=994334 RepID=A0A433Q3I0_9FUNG|nr:hypothetical protein BC938DRAFT_473722 [Jimgerdemannia flammicorona]